MSKRQASKNSSNELVIIPKTTPTTSADTVPLSVQFKQIQAAVGQQVLQKTKPNLSISSKY